MGFSFRKDDLVDQKQAGPNEGRWGRPLQAAAYEQQEIVFVDETKNANSFDLVFVVKGSETQTPEGPVKVNYRVEQGKPSLKSFLQVFFPHLLKDDLTDDQRNFDPQEVRGCRANVVIRRLPEKARPGGGEPYHARDIVSSISGPGTWPAANVSMAPKQASIVQGMGVSDEELPF